MAVPAVSGRRAACRSSTAQLLRAGRVIAVDCIQSRLELARAQEAEVIDFEEEAFMSNAIDAYKAFDRREPWWIKVILETNAQRGRPSPMVS